MRLPQAGGDAADFQLRVGRGGVKPSDTGERSWIHHTAPAGRRALAPANDSAAVAVRRRLGGNKFGEALDVIASAASSGRDWAQEPAPASCAIPCFCKDHFDWSPIEPLHAGGLGLAPISVMRHPVDRAISHFYFCKTLPWTAGMRIREQSLSECAHPQPTSSWMSRAAS